MRIKYFYDPLCGWCYGASPAIEKAEALGFKVEAYSTGLFAEQNGQVMSPNWSEYAWTNDQRIQKITGQVFSAAYRRNVLSNFGIRFDSWMPTLAVTIHESRFKGESLKILRAIQKARYVDGLDNTNPAVLSGIAKNFGWSSNVFLEMLNSSDLQEQTRREIARNLTAYASYHAKGIPLIVIEEEGEERILNSSSVFKKDPNPMDWLKNQTVHHS